jgi:hypothetical protein
MCFPDSSFLGRWLIYFGILAYGWCALAVVGFILSMAFLADSGRIDTAYIRNLADVAKVLFLWPVLAAAALSALAAALHGWVAGWIHRVFRKGSTPSLTGAGTHLHQQSASDKVAGQSWRHLVLPLFITAACLASMSVGILIIIRNAPRSLQEHGPGITIFTSCVFLLPLVAVPSVILLRTLRRLRRNSR